MSSIKEMVSGGKSVTFSHFSDNQLWYKTECGFEFPISEEDSKGATFMAQDRAMLFMRFIRKHFDEIEAARLMAQAE